MSLFHMLEFNAREFITLTNAVKQLEILFCNLAEHHNMADAKLTERSASASASGPDSSESSGPSLVKAVKDRVTELRRDMRKSAKLLGLDAVLAQLRRIKYAVDEECTVRELGDLFKELRQRIEDQLRQRLFLFVPAGKARTYTEKQLFGADVESKLPATIGDIEEGGKCLALGRATATVFHVMRVLEVGVAELAKRLGPGIRTDQPWGVILQQVDNAITALGNTGTDVSDYRDVSASLHAVKSAWRNPTMHPLTKYTEDEAEEIFNASRTFMRRLIAVI